MIATMGADQSAQPERPGRMDGVCSEFTVFTKIKPGHADALREGSFQWSPQGRHGERPIAAQAYWGPCF